MTPSSLFVPLDKGLHDRESFDCGRHELNDYIRRMAAVHIRAGVGHTMVLPADSPESSGKLPICAFFAVAPGSVKRVDLPEDMARKLPQYPVPVFVLAQLAVHVRCRGTGLGGITLVRALEHLHRVNSFMKAYAVVVDCLNDSAEAFHLKHGFSRMCSTSGRTRLFLPMRTVSALFR
jgi:GNAT superfamily N-acetyltransferase